MNDCDLFPDEYIANDCARDVYTREDALIVEGQHWQVVDLEAVGHEANAASVPVKVCYHNHLVAEF
jgi:hypothetical protein